MRSKFLGLRSNTENTYNRRLSVWYDQPTSFFFTGTDGGKRHRNKTDTFLNKDKIVETFTDLFVKKRKEIARRTIRLTTTTTSFIKVR